MNSNQKKLQRMIRRQEFVISDQEFFLSAAFQNHLTSLARASTGRFQQGLQVVIDWDESKNADVAYTDSYKTYCNAANPIRIPPIKINTATKYFLLFNFLY